jgi:hypothetical protein
VKPIFKDANLIRILTKTIMKHAGLSEFDREAVEAEAKAIIRDLRKAGYDLK